MYDSVTLHSWQKLRYKRFPWKLLFDLFCLLIAVGLLALTVSQTAGYANASSDVFENVFGLGSDGAQRIYSGNFFFLLLFVST